MLNFTIKHALPLFLLFMAWVTTPLPGFGQAITGTVFRDFNSNGLYEPITDPASYTYGEPGVGGVRITAYNASGAAIATAVSSTATASIGTYTLVVGNSEAYRVEFTNLLLGDYEAFRGGNSGTSVQFVNGGEANVNLGVNYPADYCQSVSPQLITTCFISADPTSGNPSITQRVALVGTPYTVEDDSKTMNYFASVGEVGSTWGVAYNRSTGQIYSASFTKRHVGFSAGGPNAIYITSPTSASSGNTTEFFNFTTIGGTAVSSTTETHGNDLPTTTASLASHDSIAFDAVGKTSLGGIDLSDDDKTLYVVNLKNRTLYSIDVATKTATGVPIPNPGCTTSSTATEGSYRPFAVKFYRGKVYVGVVCTREDLGTTTVPYGPTDGLSATVYAIDPATPASFTTVLSFPLTYQKGASGADVLPNSPTNPARSEFWRPWISIYQADRNEGVVSFPQPWLTDIEFEPTTGDMLIGLRDRFGDQTGYKNYKPGSNTDLISGITPGEILRARKCSPTDVAWTIENDGSLCGVVTSASATQTTTAGPGTGKYYWGDRVQNGANHGLSSQGGIAQLGGSAKVAMTAIDPTEIFNTGGIKRLINATGAKDGNPTGIDPNPAAGGILYEEDAYGYGKANGLGDLELACQPAPIEIGNRVWFDTNDNGVQDPGEPPLAGVEVTLRGSGLSSPVSVTTNSAGEYYFSSSNGTPSPGFVYSLTGLTPGGSYSLAFPASFSTVMLSSRHDLATGPNADNIDSDPNSDGVIAFVLGQAGQNNFSFDAAYATCALALTGTPSSCDGTTNRYTVSGTVSFSNVSAGTLTVTDGLVSTTLSVSAGTTSIAYSLSGLATGSGSHTITASYSRTDCSPASVTYSAPVTCPLLELEKRVDKSKAELGEILSYTLVLTNTGSLTATNVTVRDSATVGLTYVPNSASAPAGTSWLQGNPRSSWTIATMSPGESLSLTFQAKADSTGILYNTASIPGDTARACTSVPVHMCVGDDYAFVLTAPAGHTSYQWYKDGQAIPNATTDTLEVTERGSYSLAVDNGAGSGQCPNFSCCPFIVVEDSLPTFLATALPASCIGNTPQTNGQIVLSAFQAGNTFQYSLGATFNAAASVSGVPQIIPANGVIANTLLNPVADQVYTVRVYNASGCYTDKQVILLKTTCGCPADICVPYVLTQNKRPVRIGDPR